MTLMVPQAAVETILSIAGEHDIDAWTIGEIVAGEREVLLKG